MRNKIMIIFSSINMMGMVIVILMYVGLQDVGFFVGMGVEVLVWLFMVIVQGGGGGLLLYKSYVIGKFLDYFIYINIYI